MAVRALMARRQPALLTDRAAQGSRLALILQWGSCEAPGSTQCCAEMAPAFAMLDSAATKVSKVITLCAADFYGRRERSADCAVCVAGDTRAAAVLKAVY